MKILIVSSTKFEIAPLFSFFSIEDKNTKKKFYTTEFFSNNIDILITGIGTPKMIYYLTKTLQLSNYDLIINAGFAGSFKKSIPIGSVVNVESDFFADLGVDDNGIFKSIFDIKLDDPNEFPFIGGKLFNKTYKYKKFFDHLKAVSAITLNTVSGDEKKIKFLKKKFNADIETMEGAGFFFVAMKENTNFYQIRAISNAIEARDKSKWQMLKAQFKLSDTLKMIIMNILSES